MVLFAFFLYALLLLFSAFITWKWGSFQTWQFLPFPEHFWEDTGIILISSFLIVFFSQWLNRKFEWARRLSCEFIDILGKMSVIDAFALASFSALGEEILFRGTLQPLWGWVATSLLFGLIHHGKGWHFVAWTVFALFLGFLLGGLMMWRGGLYLPVGIHFLVNFSNFLLLSSQKSKLNCFELLGKKRDDDDFSP